MTAYETISIVLGILGLLKIKATPSANRVAVSEKTQSTNSKASTFGVGAFFFTYIIVNPGRKFK